MSNYLLQVSTAGLPWTQNCLRLHLTSWLILCRALAWQLSQRPHICCLYTHPQRVLTILASYRDYSTVSVLHRSLHLLLYYRFKANTGLQTFSFYTKKESGGWGWGSKEKWTGNRESRDISGQKCFSLKMSGTLLRKCFQPRNLEQKNTLFDKMYLHVFFAERM